MPPLHEAAPANPDIDGRLRPFFRTAGMELPDALKSIGEQIDAGADIVPEDDFFEAYDVFSAEMGRIFTLPWLVVDHASRLAPNRGFLAGRVGVRPGVLGR